MADWLTALADGEPARIAVAIEVPRGPVVETLLERGFHVFAINPKQLDRFRDRHSPAGAKDDRRDGFVLADSLRTDRPAFRQVHVDDPLLIQLRELSRAEEELQTELRRLSNRLWEQLQRFYPPGAPAQSGGRRAVDLGAAPARPDPGCRARVAPRNARPPARSASHSAGDGGDGAR